ncbi:hypothetical protein B566_EDAN000784 [Ephemera danica]|nr:hypothetical protein B566_EDAN000784 [Ephemera danica]
MQTPTSSSASSSLAGESPRLRRARASITESLAGGLNATETPPAPSTPSKRLTMTLPRVPKMPSFLALASPKKLAHQHSVPLQEVKANSLNDIEYTAANEPSRFLGDGVSFKAKLIGILEVGEARGDRMCQEALADLKMAIRAAGEHKQRITINIAIDGLRLRDEKTTDCLYHHPVHKISFIAQDMTDSRAFGYIFGSPDTGHRFFGIKTDKAAGQVVVAMRDLFQVVFELKKKEIELAKLQIEQQQQFKGTSGKSLESLVSPKVDSSGAETSESAPKSRSTRDELRENGCVSSATLKKRAQQTSEVIADLLDLEIELNSIQQGIHQMEKITPSDPFGPDATKDGASSASFHDPFEDSFSPPVPKTKASSSAHPALLPPPPSSTRSADLMNTTGRQGRSGKRVNVANLNLDTGPLSPSNVTTPNSASTSAPYASTETWFDSRSDPLFGDNDLPINLAAAGNNSFSTISATSSAAAASSVQACCRKEQGDVEQGGSGQFDVFTELDPLGTGKSRPYVDKKDFFQELKNPPKKVLKELAGEPKEGEPSQLFSATFEPSTQPGYSRVVHSPPVSNVLSHAPRSPDIAGLDPFADTDPFGETDPFVDEHMPDSATFPPDGTDPFDTCFADFTMFGSQQRDKKGNAASVYHGPLRVSLPPEKSGTALLPPPPTSRRSSPTPSKPKSPRLTKQISAAASTTLVRLPSPKSVHSKSSRRLAKQHTLADTRSMLHSPPSPLRNLADEERLSSSSLELTDIAPEPPPRPAASKPPPLPPKRQQQSGVSLKPPPRPPPTEQYDYINHNDEAEDSTSPPLPVPVRRPRSRGSEIPRPRQQSSVEFTNFSLPPPPAPSVAREEKKIKNTGAAANLTLRQLTKMNISELATNDFGEAGTGPDKYAALREICSEPPLADEESEKEDSVTEAVGEKMEEDFNLLTLSRQQSESPESPVQEAANVRESQSIIESTIFEEEVVSDAGSHEEKPSVDTKSYKSITPNKLSTETSPVKRSPTPTPHLPPLERIAPPTELPLPAREKPIDDGDKEERWAKFDEGDSVESRSHNEEAVSPWSLEGREFPAGKMYRESPPDSANHRTRRKYGSRRESPWHEDEDEEDGEDWEGRGPRGENGWRDESRGARPRKHSPWGRGAHHRTSPWEDDDEEGDVEEYDDMIYKTRPPPRATSIERRSRRPPSWEDDEADYDEPRPVRRVVGWAGSQQERDRRREYEDKRERSGSRGEYIERRRWEREEEESGKARRNVSKYPVGYATWGERGSRKAAQERRSRESAMRRKQFESHYWHYRDQRPSADYEYEEPESYDVRYKAKKTGAWPKRPSSASDVRKVSRRGFQSPSSTHSHDAEQEENFPERSKFRTQSSEQSRGWSNDPHDFNSDQEPEYAGEKMRESYEQRSHTLHSRRNQRQKRGARLPSDDFFSPQQKSPFEDDFSTHSFHASEFSSIDSPSAESGRKQELARRKDSQLSEPELKLPSSSPMEEIQIRGRESPPSRNKASLGSSRRQSPFEDDFTPPETRRGSGRVPSSISSDVSEQRRSPHDENLTPNRGHAPLTTRGGSLAVDDVFLPTSVIDPLEAEPPESLDNKVFEPRRTERRGWSEDQSTSRPYASMKSRLSVLRATDSNPNIKKSESVNIFARDNDPFDDDFFAESQNAQLGHRLSVAQEKPKNSSASSFSKWSEPFDNFDFKEEED